jgi:Bacterial protein of unknown function (DUF922)
MIKGCYFAVFVMSAVAGASEKTVYDTPEWKKEIATGYLPYHQLISADFPIDDKAHPRSRIYTTGFFHYEYKYRCAVRAGRASACVTKWIVRSGFDQHESSRKSWFAPFPEVLLHEQGHLDINEIYSRHLAETELDKLPVGEGVTAQEAVADLRGKLGQLADQCSRCAQAEQDRYDAETAHGANKLKQEEATAAIASRLQQTSGVSASAR